MENTGSLRFKNDEAVWIVSVGDQWVGPLRASELVRKIDAGELSWVHFVIKTGGKDWRRACDIEEFKAALPQEPKVKAPELTKPKVIAGARAPDDAPKDFFIYYNDVQMGPLSLPEVTRAIEAQTLDETAFLWKEGMEDWKPLAEAPEFKGLFAKKGPPKTPPAPKKSSGTAKNQKPADKRGTPRRPLVAKIMAAASGKLVSGICRDVSIGGMQVLTDQVPGEVGDTIKLNVTPPTSSGVKPFVAEGQIVRLLEDRRGFSFRFAKLSSEASHGLEAYIRASA